MKRRKKEVAPDTDLTATPIYAFISRMPSIDLDRLIKTARDYKYERFRSFGGFIPSRVEESIVHSLDKHIKETTGEDLVTLAIDSLCRIAKKKVQCISDLSRRTDVLRIVALVEI